MNKIIKNALNATKKKKKNKRKVEMFRPRKAIETTRKA